MQCLLLKFFKISFIRCRIKILHQPFPSILLILLNLSVLSLILGFKNVIIYNSSHRKGFRYA
ncbi:MAG TPA: hypothetical protein HPP56_06910 [Nitrospirae bacterium]|nr:hypothetical protein [Nitrospirota bacterium]